MLRRKDEVAEDDILTRRANKMAIYFLNKDKKYDLDNYLYHKWITPMDYIRCAWYLLTIKTGYADTYRNEQYLPKTDLWYNHERKMLAINTRNPDCGALAQNLLRALSVEIAQIL